MSRHTATARPGHGHQVLDLVSLLHPSAGLVDAYSVESPPGPGPGLWQVTMRLSCPHAPREPTRDLQSCVTGACAPTRTEAMVRAVGEAVERTALHGGPGVVATADELGRRALDGNRPDVSLTALDPSARMSWYPARRARTGERLLVPAGLVDYPGDAGVEGFDPGPSGAAAGRGHDAALRAALLETIERDAVIVSWARRLRTRAVDLDGLLRTAPEGSSWRRVEELLGIVAGMGLTPVVAELPLSVPGVRCVVGGVRAGHGAHPAICLGAKVSDDPALAVAGAMSEGLQLVRHLLDVRDRRAASPPPAVITGDNDRLAFLASAEGAAAVAGWLADPAPSTLPVTAPPADTARLLAMTAADGLDPLLLDLTPRLPSTARALGWSVVKVVPVGYQPLRVDERSAFGWNRVRLATATTRTGMPARLPEGQLDPAPHPLP